MNENINFNGRGGSRPDPPHISYLATLFFMENIFPVLYSSHLKRKTITFFFLK